MCSDKTPAALFFRYNTQLGPPYQVRLCPRRGLQLKLWLPRCGLLWARLSAADCPLPVLLSTQLNLSSPLLQIHSRQVLIDTNFINFSIRNKIDLVKVGMRRCRECSRLLLSCIPLVVSTSPPSTKIDVVEASKSKGCIEAFVSFLHSFLVPTHGWP